MKRYSIEVFKVYEKVTFYTIQEEDAELTVTDEFLSRFVDKEEYSRDLQLIKSYFEKMGNDKGALERYFRPERNASALPISPPKSKLRLYCYRLNDNIVILGGGGKKTSKKVQNCPDCLPHFELMNSLAYILTMKIGKGEIAITNSQLSGELSFYIKPKT